MPSLKPRLPRLRPAPPVEEARRIERAAEVRAGRRSRFWAQVGRVDQKLLVAMRTRGHTPATEHLATTLGTFGEWGAIWVALGFAGTQADPQRAGRWGVAALAAPTAVVANYGVKVLAGRERPLIEDHPPLARAPSKLSFPRAHSTSSMAGAIALGRVEPRARGPLLGLALAICACRPFLGMHYPSDVAAGIAARHASSAAPGRCRGVESGARIWSADEGRDRRDAERGQVDALQRADPGRRRVGRTTRSRRSSPTSRSRPSPTSGSTQVAATIGSTPIVHETLEVHDIAGLVKGRISGEGLGNQFLASIRETDAICHVVRAHGDDGDPPPRRPDRSGRRRRDGRGRADARRPRHGDSPARARRQAGEGARQGGDRRAATGSSDVVAALERGEPVRSVPAPDAAPDAVRELQALTSKPVLYIANVDEGEAEPPAELRRARPRGRRRGDRAERARSRPSWSSSTTRRRR